MTRNQGLKSRKHSHTGPIVPRLLHKLIHASHLIHGPVAEYSPNFHESKIFNILDSSQLNLHPRLIINLLRCHQHSADLFDPKPLPLLVSKKGGYLDDILNLSPIQRQ